MAPSGFLVKNLKILVCATVPITIVVLFAKVLRTTRHEPLYAQMNREMNQLILNSDMSSSQDETSKYLDNSNDYLQDVSVPLNFKTALRQDISVSSKSRKTFLSQSLDTDHDKLCPEKIAVKDINRNEIPMELYKIAPDVFDQVPSKFLDGVRSPCWRRESDNKMFCLPSFILAGVGKCGTTDVWDKIVQHPEIVRVFKEPRWWTRERLGRDRKSKRPVSVQGYFRHFQKLAQQVAQNASAARNLITGDGSPSIYWDNILWKNSLTSACSNATTPRYVISDVIGTILPQSKVIAVFRNPTDRLYSDYLFDNRSCTREFFHQSVVKTTRMFDTCLARSSRRTCVFEYFSHIYAKDKPGSWPMMRIFKGFYSVFITDWLDAFPRDQLMFIRLEDWHRDCEEMLPDIYRFLELAPLSRNRTDDICGTKQRNPTRGKKKKGPMLEETRNLLQKFYRPTLQKLAEVLEDDRFLWAD